MTRRNSSDKTSVIERIWEVLEAEGKNRRTVYFQDVLLAIAHCNAQDGKNRSVKNPANFMKDLIRKDSASENWPPSLAAYRIGGRQRVGKERVFEFRSYEPGQTEPFPNVLMPKPDTAVVELQSLSLPLASKALGRQDESWLVQTAVSLNVLEHHLSRYSRHDVKELVHLQTGVKLGNNSEVDGLFRAIVEVDGKRTHVLITCEAKQQGQRILEHQVVEQIAAAYKSVRESVPEEELAVSSVLPMAIKAIPPNGDIYVVEFDAWTPEEALAEESAIKELLVLSEAVYRLRPPVPGIGYKPPRPRKHRSKS
jgi:hypothetical protein